MKKTPDERVEEEIARLSKLPAVKLAQKEQRILAGRRKYLPDLRWLEKRCKQLLDAGWTPETIILMYRDDESEKEVI